MNLSIELPIKFIISYLLGSISGGMLIGIFKHVDIRKMGSGNAGGTNAFRTMGAQFALAVLFIDVIKGFIAVKFVPTINIIGLIPRGEANVDIVSIFCGSGVVLGHVYPLYYNFKGGKGAGTNDRCFTSIIPCRIGYLYILLGNQFNPYRLCWT